MKKIVLFFTNNQWVLAINGKPALKDTTAVKLVFKNKIDVVEKLDIKMVLELIKDVKQ